MEDGSAFNVFAQHELSGNQIGLQFAIRVNTDSLSLLVGMTHSNSNREYEITIQNLKGEQRAFNLRRAVPAPIAGAAQGFGETRPARKNDNGQIVMHIQGITI